MGSDPINPAGDVLTHWEEASRLKGFGNGRVLPLVPPLARRAARELGHSVVLAFAVLLIVALSQVLEFAWAYVVM